MEFSKRLAVAIYVTGLAISLAAGVAVAQTRVEPVLISSTSGLNAMFAGGGFGASIGGHAPAAQGYLGIAFHDVNDGEIAPMHLKDGHGAEIIMVDHDGPAGKAGLQVHDVVLSVGGVTVDGEDQLRKMLHDTPPGKSIVLYICRGGVEQTVTAVMSTREEVDKQARQRYIVPLPADEPVIVAAPAEPPAKSGFSHGYGFLSGHLLPLSSAYTGATVDAMGSQLADYFGVKDGKGLLVHEVETNSPAASAGLRAGDVIVKINGGHVATEKDWTRALRDSKGHAVSMTVVRERHEQTLTMVPDSKKRSAVDQPGAPSGSLPPVMMLR